MKRSLLLITSILLLTTTVRAQDTAKAKQTPVQQQTPYKIFMFTEEVAKDIFNSIGACPDDIKGGMSLKEMRQLYANEFNHQPAPDTNAVATAKPVEAKKKKK